MELLFNELSISPFSTDKYKANEKMKQFSETVAIARRKGFRNIRSHFDSSQIELSENYSLHNWLTSMDIPEVYRNNLYGMLVLPFIKDNDEEIEEQYIEADYYFEDIESGIAKTKCLGLTSAYLYETPSISFSSLPVWNRTKLFIIVEKENSVSTESVFNISSKTSFDDILLAEFIENLGTLTLFETELKSEDKKQHLADHHGKAELQELCNQIKHSPNVIEMHSTDWGGKKFIRKVHADGVVEIVLFRTQRQYALWVLTTGRNLRETKAIADILEERYS